MVGRGYELDNGDQVVLTDEELATAAPRKTRTIDIEAFVDLADVDPIYFDHPYFLLPAGEGEGSKRAYQLLLKVMQRTDRAALGRFVMRTKEYLVIVRVRDDLLALTTMLFHDEIRPAKGIPAGGKKPKKAQLDRAIALIEALAVDWDPSQYEDRYRERLLDVIKRKKKGKRITVPDDERQPSPVPDLMAALEESLKAAKGGGDARRRRRTSPGSAARSSTSVPRTPTSRAGPRCPRTSWSRRSTAASRPAPIERSVGNVGRIVPPDLLDRILSEIRDRKRRRRPPTRNRSRPSSGRSRHSTRPSPRARRGVGPGAGPLRGHRPAGARRGANREAILAAVGERPGATAREIADFTGIARATVASTVTRLAADGVLERSELPAGGLGSAPPARADPRRRRRARPHCWV